MSRSWGTAIRIIVQVADFATLGCISACWQVFDQLSYPGNILISHLSSNSEGASELLEEEGVRETGRLSTSYLRASSFLLECTRTLETCHVTSFRLGSLFEKLLILLGKLLSAIMICNSGPPSLMPARNSQISVGKNVKDAFQPHIGTEWWSSCSLGAIRNRNAKACTCFLWSKPTGFCESVER
jgi:hypothetical protein